MRKLSKRILKALPKIILYSAMVIVFACMVFLILCIFCGFPNFVFFNNINN